MKSSKSLLTFLLAGLSLIALSATAFAAESWAVDPATGAKIGWVSTDDTLNEASWSGPVVNGKAEGKGSLVVTLRDKGGKDLQGRGEVEMVSGLLDGKGVLKWPGGSSYDGYFRAGVKEGNGVYTWRNGTVFTGSFKNGEANGYGVLKDASGKVLYSGEWKDSKELAAPRKADKVVGIPWGASEEEAARIMSERPNTRCQLFAKSGVGKTKGCYSTFNDENVFIQIGFYQGKMYSVLVCAYASEEQIMEKFSSYKQGLSGRYGAPSLEKGKYLDASVSWDLGGGYSANLTILKNTNKPNQWPESQFFALPFAVMINYSHSETNALVNKAQGPGAGKDF